MSTDIRNKEKERKKLAKKTQKQIKKQKITG